MVAERFVERALVVDDDDAIRMLVSRILEREGFVVDDARDGFDAIQKLRRTEYGVIFLDLMMPRVDGHGVLRYLRNNRNDLLYRVVIMTANPPDQLEQPISVISKPFDLTHIIEVAKRHLSEEDQIAN